MGACVLVCSKDPRNLSEKQKKYLDRSPNPQQIRRIAEELENQPQKTHMAQPSMGQVEEPPKTQIIPKQQPDNLETLLQGSLTAKKSRFCPQALKTSSITSTTPSKTFAQDYKQGSLPSKEISTLAQFSNEASVGLTSKLTKTSKKDKQNSSLEISKKHHSGHHRAKEQSGKQNFVDLYENKTESRRRRLKKSGKASNQSLGQFSSFEAQDFCIEDSQTSPCLITATRERGCNNVRSSITKNPNYLQHHFFPEPQLKPSTPTQEALVLKTLNFKSAEYLNEQVHYQDGISYLGEWRSGMKEGKGKLIWKEGVYQGRWKKDQMEGHGKIIFSNGEIYEGSFKENKAEGGGIFNFSNGSVYKGQWKHNKQNGFGVQQWPNNEYYEGNWVQGTKTGKGELFFSDGSYYKGNFQNNEWHGQGQYYWHQKCTYKGMWKHNKKSGRGVLRFLCGDRYEGDFEDDKYHGKGKLVQKDGRIYIGNFERGKKEGYIDEQTPEGEKKRGFWAYGKLLYYQDEVDEKQKIKILKKLEKKSSLLSDRDHY